MTATQTPTPPRDQIPVVRVSVPQRSLGSELRAIRIVWRRELLRFVNDRLRIVTSLVQPFLFLFVLGSGLQTISRRGTHGVDLKTFLYPGILCMAVMFTAMFSAASIVWDREFGFLKEIQVAPLSRVSVALGKTLGGSSVAVLQASLLLLVSPLVGVWFTPGTILAALGLLLLLAFTLSAIGVAVASRMKTMEGFQLIMNFVLLPLLFLSGAFFPLANLPLWLAVLTHLDPAAYAVDALRRVVLASAGVPPETLARLALTAPSGEPLPLGADVAVLLGFSLPALALAVRWFGRAE